MKKCSLDIVIEILDFVFQGNYFGFPNILQLKKGNPCLANPGFKVWICATLCVSDAVQIYLGLLMSELDHLHGIENALARVVQNRPDVVTTSSPLCSPCTG